VKRGGIVEIIAGERSSIPHARLLYESFDAAGGRKTIIAGNAYYFMRSYGICHAQREGASRKKDLTGQSKGYSS